MFITRSLSATKNIIQRNTNNVNNVSRMMSSGKIRFDWEDRKLVMYIYDIKIIAYYHILMYSIQFNSYVIIFNATYISFIYYNLT